MEIQRLVDLACAGVRVGQIAVSLLRWECESRDIRHLLAVLAVRQSISVAAASSDPDHRHNRGALGWPGCEADRKDVRPVIPAVIAVGAIGLIPATGHGPSAVRTGTAAAKAAARRMGTGVGYYDTSTRIVVDTHGCANAGDLTAFGIVWIGGSTPRSWVGWSIPRPGTMHRTSFSHATFRADGGGAVEFKHPDGRVFDSLECALQ